MKENAINYWKEDSMKNTKTKPNKSNIAQFTIQVLNLDGNGPKRCRVYSVPHKTAYGYHDYWSAVTNVLCPICEKGLVRWAEGGYVPGYRICDECGKHFLAKGTETKPTLIRVGTRKSKVG